MKHLISISFLFIFLAFKAFPQKSYMKFGKVSKEELEIQVYEKDSSAAAVILGAVGLTEFTIFDDNWHVLFTKHVRIKILKKEGIDKGTQSIYIYESGGSAEEEIQGLRGVVFNMEDGKLLKSKLNRGNLLKEKLNKNWVVQKVVLPDVKVGSIIDLTYTISSPFIFQLRDWDFQDDIPTIHSEYLVKIPKYFNYKNWIEGFEYVSKTTESYEQNFQYKSKEYWDPQGSRTTREGGDLISFSEMVNAWKYTAQDIPALKDEPFVANMEDYTTAVKFELLSTQFPGSTIKSYTTTWEAISEDILKDNEFGVALKHSNHLNDVSEKIFAEAQNDQEKIILAYNYIKSNILWDGRFRVYSDGPLRRSYSDKKGNSADINLNLIALLRKLELKVDPVLISTRSHGKIRRGQAILSQFNHVIAYVQFEESTLLLDASEKDCPISLLPKHCLNQVGRLIIEGGGQWVNLYSKIPADEMKFAMFKLDEENLLKGSIQHKSSNYSAVEFRSDLKDENSEEDFIRSYEQRIPGAAITEFELIDVEDINKPVVLKASMSIEEAVIDGGDILYINPNFLDHISENLFKTEERKYPIDFNYPIKRKQVLSISIPPSYKIIELPKPMALNLPDGAGRFVFIAKQVGNNLQFSKELIINETVIPADKYIELKSFYDHIISKESEQVVIQKL